MKYTDYHPKALRTECTYGRKHPTYDTATCDRLAHGALGLASDWLELKAAMNQPSLQQQLMEAGDVIWFANILADTFKQFPQDDDYKAFVGKPNIVACERLIEELVSTIKAALFYHKDIPESVKGYPAQIISRLQAATAPHANLRHDVLDINIEKLAKRYPEKFTTNAAINRDVATEEAAVAKVMETAAPVVAPGVPGEKRIKILSKEEIAILERTKHEEPTGAPAPVKV